MPYRQGITYGNRASCARQPVPLISLEPTITGHQNSDIRGST
jgi:hypothetical protein